ncbi:MAG: response regulator, partial [Bdellovibrionales bacterium]
MGIDKAIDDHLNTQAYNPANFDDKIVLVVEDDRSHRNMMVNILSSCGFQTIQAESGFDALSQIDGADRPFDLIIMDWDMPGLDGLETTRAIRLREGKTGTLRTPVVAFTDHRKAEDRNICLASGMDAYLPKDALMPQWRQTLIDNLQGLFAGDFDISDFDTPETNVAQAAQFDLDEFDEELFSHTARLLKEDLQIEIRGMDQAIEH